MIAVSSSSVIWGVFFGLSALLLVVLLWVRVRMARSVAGSALPAPSNDAASADQSSTSSTPMLDPSVAPFATAQALEILAPKWYPDPWGSEGLRWWDGSAWTGSVYVVQRHQPPPPVSASWPTRQEIVAVLASQPERLVTHECLECPVFQRGPTGIRCLGGGNTFAVPLVVANGDEWMLRFFNGPPEGSLADRYRSIEQMPLESRQALGVPALYWLDSFLQNGRSEHLAVPAVLMRRVAGSQLDRFVGENYRDRFVMSTAAARLRDRLLAFESMNFGHGDLQDGNVLVNGEGSDLSVWFVDFDDCFLPGLTCSNAVGHPNYQHPRRSTSDWGPHMDGFSGLLIWLALRAIAIDPKLWEDNEDDGRLLFDADDLLNPGETELWRTLMKSPDREVRDGTERLRGLCMAERPPSVSFTSLLPGWW